MLVASSFDLWRMVMYCRVQHELGQQALTQMSLDHQATVQHLHAELAERQNRRHTPGQPLHQATVADTIYQVPTLETTMEAGSNSAQRLKIRNSDLDLQELEVAQSGCPVQKMSRVAASQGPPTQLRPRKVYRCKRCGQPKKGHACPAVATMRDVARKEGALYRCRQEQSTSSHQLVLQQHIDSILIDSSDTESEDAHSDCEQERASNHIDVTRGQVQALTSKSDTALAVKCEETPTHLNTLTPTRRQSQPCSHRNSPLIASTTSSPFSVSMGSMAGTQTKLLAAIAACNAADSEDKENCANQRCAVDVLPSRQVRNAL